jgi:hypothetical protein
VKGSNSQRQLRSALLCSGSRTLHTLTHFLDRFVYRTPKANASSRGASIMQPLGGGVKYSWKKTSSAATSSAFFFQKASVLSGSWFCAFFLDRFVYRTPKANASSRGASIMQPLGGGEAADRFVLVDTSEVFVEEDILRGNIVSLLLPEGFGVERRFVYRTPKANASSRGASIMQPLGGGEAADRLVEARGSESECAKSDLACHSWGCAQADW